MQNCIATLEDSLAVSYKTKHILTIRSRNHAPWYIPKGFENVYPHKILQMMLIAFSFMTAKTWKQSRCPSVGEMINHGKSR